MKFRTPASSNFPMYEMTSTYNLLPKMNRNQKIN